MTNIPWPTSIALIVFDFDGVMTDNRVLVLENGCEAVFCNRADGLGIDYLREAGAAMAILSTEVNPVVTMRAKKLRLPVLHGLSDKGKVLAELLDGARISPSQVVYIGNDKNDLGCLSMVGLPIVVADAHPNAAAAAKYILDRKGGDGAVRRFADLLLHDIAAGRTALRNDISINPRIYEGQDDD